MELTITSQNLNKPSFGAIKYEAAKDTLREVLSLNELQHFKEMVNAHSGNKYVDAIFFGEGKKLTGRVVNAMSGSSYYSKDYTPRLFEKKMNFIKRIVKYMVDRTQKAKELYEKQKFEF